MWVGIRSIQSKVNLRSVKIKYISYRSTNETNRNRPRSDSPVGDAVPPAGYANANDGGYWAEVPAIPGCATEGDSWDELISNLHEAIEGCLSVDSVQ